MNTIHRGLGALTVVALGVGGLAACTSATALPSDPVALTMFHVDGGPELDPAVDWFVDEVAGVSDGRVTIEVVRGCCDDAVDIEQDLIGQVAEGGADLGWVGTRAFEEVGVDALLPLTAPLFVDGYGLQEAALSSDAAREALASVSAAGVTGVALVPGQIRRPLSVEAPLIALDDWTGVPVAAFHAEQNTRSLAALGAEPKEVTFEQRDTGIYERTILGLENSLTMQDLDREETLPYATANVGLWPRTSAIVAAPESPAVTDAAVRQVLIDAAAAVVARTGEFAAIDQAALESACADGARFGKASTEQLDALRAAVHTIWTELAADDDTKELYAEIAAARDTVEAESPTVPAECTGTAPAAQPGVGSDDVSIVNGHWSTPTYSYDDLIAGGLSEEDAHNAEGVFVLSFDDGAFALKATVPSGEVFGCVGDYTIAGERMTVIYRPDGDCGGGGVFFTADFALEGSTLTLSNMADALESDIFLFSSAPLVKVD